MSVSSQSSRGGGLTRAPSPSGLYDVLDLILDKGLVIDLYVRVSLIGIEILTIDARIVIASVDTYLRFAEATNRLDLAETGSGQTLPELVGEMQESGASKKTKGALEGVKDKVSDVIGGGDEDDDDEQEEEKERTPARRRRTSSSSRSSSSSGSSSGRTRRNIILIGPLVSSDSTPSAAPMRSATAGSPRRAARLEPTSSQRSPWSAALDRP